MVKAHKLIGSPYLKGARGLHLGVGHDQGALDKVVQHYGVDVLRAALTMKRYKACFNVPLHSRTRRTIHDCGKLPRGEKMKRSSLTRKEHL